MSRKEPTRQAHPVAVSSRTADSRGTPDTAGAARFGRVLGALRRESTAQRLNTAGQAQTQEVSPDGFADAGLFERGAYGVNDWLTARGDDGGDDEASPDRSSADVGDAPNVEAGNDADDPPTTPDPPPACDIFLPVWFDVRSGSMPSESHEGGRRGEGRGGNAEGAVGSALPGEALPGWLSDTVDVVLSLCARLDPAFQTWHLTLPLDARHLPDSELHVSLSPHALALRFRTQSEQSAHQISHHRLQLQALLAQMPELPPHIDIELD